ncbi:LPS-assembly lipoprotein LptE [Pseudomaricurvus sp.]|uniref:LPS-assembly lipoprotein LptE n=1 Tax=Pseudomaricurvus sp. TaxID=2004510 RepID=UPI003F6C1D59
MKKLLTILVSTVLTTTLLSACGWHLRGSMSMPLDLESVFVTADDSHGSLITDLKRTLVSNNVTTTDNSAEAQYSIILSNEEQDRRTVSVGNDALAAEYELNMSVDYRITNQAGEEVANNNASTYRSYTFNRDAVVAKSEEERLIKQEMRNNLVQQILRRLRFVSQEQAQSTNPSEAVEPSSSAINNSETNGQTAP